MQKERCSFVLRYLIFTLLALGSFYLVLSYLASDYASFLGGILTRVRRPERLDHYLASSKLRWTYELLKYVLFFFLVCLFTSLYKAVVRKQGWLSEWLDRVTGAVCAFLSHNKGFWNRLDPFAKSGLFFVGVIQFGWFLFLVLSIPYHYDEAWSFRHFSGVGFVQTAAYYPYPNNHIFFNLVSRVFCFLPFPAQVCTRLPSFFASLVSTWYFFKLAHKYFNAAVALLVTILFLGGFLVVLYSVEGRGYGFLVCCTVLLFYAADHFTGSENYRKYRLLYLLAMTAGLYTVPSFLFTVLATTGIVACYQLLRKQWKSLWIFILNNAISGIATIVLYLPIIFFNGLATLTNPNGSDRLPLHSMIPQILPHLSSTFHILSGIFSLPLGFVLIPIVLTLVAAWMPVGKQRLLPWLTAGTLVSPVVLLCLFPIIPFERTWIYLSVPLALSLGYMLTLLIDFVKRLPGFGSWWQARSERGRPALIGLYAGILVLLFANFRTLHRRYYAIDYDIRRHFEKLGADIDHIHSIGFTGPSMQFYVAEDLYFQCFERNPKRQVTIGKRNSVEGFNDDVLILAPDSVASFKLAGYEFMGSNGGTYSIYIRKY